MSLHVFHAAPQQSPILPALSKPLAVEGVPAGKGAKAAGADFSGQSATGKGSLLARLVSWRQDDVSAPAYLCFDKPGSHLPPQTPGNLGMRDMREKVWSKVR